MIMRRLSLLVLRRTPPPRPNAVCVCVRVCVCACVLYYIYIYTRAHTQVVPFGQRTDNKNANEEEAGVATYMEILNRYDTQ